MQETNQPSNRREWVKNATIIFLLVMFVLTRFSDTIMKRSLPEVSTQYVGAGTITARVRGSGTVSANETYEVKLNQTRTVDSIGVKVGDTVERDDILFVLSAGDSDELDLARNELNQLRLDLQKMIVNAKAYDYSEQNAEIRRAREDLQELLNKGTVGTVTDTELKSAEDRQKALEDQIKAYQKQIEDAELRGKFQEQEWGYLYYPPEYYNTKTAMEKAQKELTELTDRLSDMKTDNSEWSTRQAEVKAAERKLEDLVRQLNATQLADNKAAQMEALEIESARQKVAEKEQLVAELQGETTGSEILSPVAGIVRAINVSTGMETALNQPLAEIDVVERGYTLSFSVTVEQAQRVRVGDKADMSGYYWGPPIDATLSSIRNDPEDPTQKRMLIFEVNGEGVQAGTQLSLSIGQRSQQYNTIVPNSALREDSNGKYVLILAARMTALGNRYIATRVEVGRVIAEDDTNSAVESALSNGDYVITSASTPIEPGMQVRMAEGL